MELACVTATCESRGMGGTPSMAKELHSCFSKSKTCVSAKCRVPSCPPCRMSDGVGRLTAFKVARYLARGRRPDTRMVVHRLRVKSNWYTSLLYDPSYPQAM
eukprot:scaffold34620_cov160-Amphora_coffeaeformis.AAC.16